MLEKQDLKEVGLPMGPIVKLLAAIKALPTPKAQASEAKPSAQDPQPNSPPTCAPSQPSTATEKQEIGTPDKTVGPPAGAKIDATEPDWMSSWSPAADGLTGGSFNDALWGGSSGGGDAVAGVIGGARNARKSRLSMLLNTEEEEETQSESSTGDFGFPAAPSGGTFATPERSRLESRFGALMEDQSRRDFVSMDDGQTRRATDGDRRHTGNPSGLDGFPDLHGTPLPTDFNNMPGGGPVGRANAPTAAPLYPLKAPGFPPDAQDAEKTRQTQQQQQQEVNPVDNSMRQQQLPQQQQARAELAIPTATQFRLMHQRQHQPPPQSVPQEQPPRKALSLAEVMTEQSDTDSRPQSGGGGNAGDWARRASIGAAAVGRFDKPPPLASVASAAPNNDPATPSWPSLQSAGDAPAAPAAAGQSPFVKTKKSQRQLKKEAKAAKAAKAANGEQSHKKMGDQQLNQPSQSAAREPAAWEIEAARIQEAQRQGLLESQKQDELLQAQAAAAQQSGAAQRGSDDEQGDDEGKTGMTKEGKRCPVCRKKVRHGSRHREVCNGMCVLAIAKEAAVAAAAATAAADGSGSA